MKKTIFISTIIIVIITLALVITYGKHQTNRPQTEQQETIEVIRVGYKAHLAHFLPFLAEQEGYFNEQGIKIEFVEFKSTNQMIDAVVTGDIDAAAAANYEAAMAAELRSPGKIKFYFNTQWKPENYIDYIIVRKESSLQSISDLKGKKLVITPGAAGLSYTKLVLEKFNISDKDITLVPLEFKFQLQTLASGKVDAALTFEPLIAMALSEDTAKVLVGGPFANYLPEMANAAGAGIISTSFIQEHPETANKFVNAIEKAIKLADDNPNKIRGVLPDCCKTTPEVAQTIKHFGVYQTIAETNKQDVQTFADFLTENGILEKHMEINNLFYEP